MYNELVGLHKKVLEALQLRVWNLHMFIHIIILSGYDVNEDLERVTKFTKVVQCKLKRWYLSWCDTLTHWPPRPVTPQFCFQLTPSNSDQAPIGIKFRADSRFVPRQWETVLLCNDESALKFHAVLFAHSPHRISGDYFLHKCFQIIETIRRVLWRTKICNVEVGCFPCCDYELKQTKIEWWNLDVLQALLRRSVVPDSRDYI